VNKQIFLLAFFIFLGPFGGNTVFSMMHRLTLEFRTDMVMMSLSLTFFMIPFAALQLVSGPLSDLWDRRKTLITGLMIFIAGHLMCALSPSIHFFLAGRVIQGLGFAFVNPVALAIIGDRVPASGRGRVMGWMGSMNTLGIATGPLLGGVLAETNWRLAFFVLALMGAFGLAIFFWSKVGGAVGKTERLPLGYLLRDVAGNRGVLTASLSGFFVFFAYITVLTTLSPYLAGPPFRLSDSQIGMVISCAGLAGILFSPFAGWTADRVGRASTSALGLMAVAIVFFTLEMAESWAAIAALFFVLGGVMAFGWAGFMTLSVELLPGARGTSTSIFNSARFFGYALAPQLSSLVFIREGMKAVFLCAAGAALAAALLAAALRKTENALREK
jgi:MFS family permease